MFLRSLMAVSTADAVVDSSNHPDQPWRDLKGRIPDLVDARQIVTAWIIDEAHNLRPEFFRDLPAFLDFAFDARDVVTIWLIGCSTLAHRLARTPYAASHHWIQCVCGHAP